MTVRDLMAKQVTTCGPQTNLAAASALMWENDCDALPVLGETGELAGVLTDRDICIALGTRDLRASELSTGDVVGGPSLSCRSTDDIGYALQVMREAKVRHLPVVDEDGVLEGMVSIDDFVRSAQRSDGDAGPGIYKAVASAVQAIHTRGGKDRISSQQNAA